MNARAALLIAWLGGMAPDLAASGSAAAAPAPAAAIRPAAPTAPANSLPAVSPDGKWIAFVSKRDSTEDVYVIGADGAGERRLTVGGGHLPRWTPDGRGVRFVRGGADSGTVYVQTLDGGAPRAVAHVQGGRNPVLSRDGRWAAYLVGPWSSTTLWVARADGGDAHAVAGGGRTTAWNAAWSPDGKRLAYTFGDSTRVLRVHIVNRDGTGDHAVTRLSADDGSAQMPAWSPDGRRLALQASRGRVHTGHVWISDLADGAATKLAPHEDGLMDEVPAWFPDGRRLAFQSNRGGAMQIWVMDADGGNLRQVTGVTP